MNPMGVKPGKNKVKADALNKVMKQKAFYESSLGVKLVPIGLRDVVVDSRATPVPEA